MTYHSKYESQFQGSQRSNSAFDMSDLASTLYNKISDAQSAM